MHLPATVKSAIGALRADTLRSALTLVAIGVGVGGVMAAVAFWSGARQRLGEHIASIGGNVLMVAPFGAPVTVMGAPSSSARSSLTVTDAEALLKECPSVREVAPILYGVGQVSYEDGTWSGTITGTSPSLLEVREWHLAEGKAFGGDDLKKAAKVCLLGQVVAETLFGGKSPVGETVKIQNIPFKVLGVLSRKGKTHTGQDQDDTVLVPLTTAQRKLFPAAPPAVASMILAKAKSSQVLEDAQQEIASVLRQRHRIGQGQDDDFTVTNVTQVMEAAHSPSRLVAGAVGAVAALCLIVGGMGIMLTLLDSVKERTKGREGPLTGAVGRANIGYQFLAEALVLSLLGGMAGVVATVLLLHALSMYTHLELTLTPVSILLGFNSSVVVGIVFGFYPAAKASRLPRVALPPPAS